MLITVASPRPALETCERFAFGPSVQQGLDPTSFHIPVCPVMAQLIGSCSPECG